MNAAERLAALVQVRTVSAAGERDEAEFARFRTLLAELYPLLHTRLELTAIGDGGLLFRWPGLADDRPVVLMAHYDVVPVDESAWQVPPFAGDIRDGAVHGRGALDDKGHLVAVADAVESLLAEDFTPAHDVYLSFGDDEEVFGTRASQVVDHLEAQGVRPWLVSDEGGAVVEGAFPGSSGPTAMVGICEKGTIDVTLRTTDAGGHSSTPRRGGATARLARAVVRIDGHPFPPRLTDPIVQMLQALAPTVPPALRPVLARADRLRRPLALLLSKAGPEAAALVRTTSVVTQLSGSPAANVLASEATANVNLRLAVGQSVDGAVARLRTVIGDESVAIAAVRGSAAPAVSRTDNAAFAHLSATIAATFPGTATVPYVQTGGTDSRHFARISDSVYRFSPFDMSREQRMSIHAAGEHLRLDSLERGIVFFRTLLRTLPS